MISLIQRISTYLKNTDRMQTVIEAGQQLPCQNSVCVCVCADPEGTFSSEDLVCSLFCQLKQDHGGPQCLSYSASWLKSGPQMCLCWPAVYVNIQKISVGHLKPSVHSGREVKSIPQMSDFLDIEVLSLEE